MSLVTLLRYPRRHAGTPVPPDEPMFATARQRLALAQTRWFMRPIPPLPDGTLDAGDRMQLARRGYGRES